MAETYDVALAPHCPLGAIALASSVHIDTTCQNAIIQEQSIGIHYNKGNDVLDYIKNKDVFDFDDGYCLNLEGPGLGIEIDEEFMRVQHDKALIQPKWRNPHWTHKDGSFAEW